MHALLTALIILAGWIVAIVVIAMLGPIGQLELLLILTLVTAAVLLVRRRPAAGTASP